MNTDEIEAKIVKHLVDRFCGWHLPKDFHPDGGISFQREYNVEYNAKENRPPSIHEPTGTNLFTAEQAKEMFRFLLENEDGRSVIETLLTSEAQKREKVVREASKKNLLVQAEQQLTGAHYYARGGGMKAVCVGMGLTQEEWANLKPQCEWLDEDEIAEIEEALPPHHPNHPRGRQS